MKRVLHTPKDRDEIYRRFIAYVEEWRVRLVLREWTVIIHLDTSDINLEGATSGAVTEYFPKYYEAKITLHLPDDTEWEDEEIENTAVHELMHILTSTWGAVWGSTHRKNLPVTMLNMLQVSEEQLCTRLALGFMRTKYPKRKP